MKFTVMLIVILLAALWGYSIMQVSLAYLPSPASIFVGLILSLAGGAALGAVNVRVQSILD